MMLTSLKRDIRLSDFLLFFFSTTYTVVKVFLATGDSNNSGNIYIAGSGLLCLFYCLIKGRSNIKSRALLGGVIISILMILSTMYNGNSKLEYLIWIWSYMGVGLIFYDYGLNNFVAAIICYGINSLLLFKAIVWGTSSGFSGVDMFMEGNNSISVLSIYAVVVYYISLARKGKVTSLPYIPILLVEVLSMIYANRGGMLAGSVLLLFILYFNLKTSKSKVKNYFVLFVILLLLIFAYIKGFEILAAGIIYKMEAFGGESSRSDVWIGYLTATFDNIFNLILGVPCYDGSYKAIAEVEGNIHNSFFILHSKFGIIAFLIVVSLQLKTIKRLSSSKQFIVLFCYFTLYVRSLLDWVAFPGIYDIFIWFSYFYIVDKKKSLIW